MHSTIAELMIFANHWVARRCLEVYPDRSCLRRHPPPKPQHFDELQRCAASRGLQVDVTSNRSLGLTLAAVEDPKDPEVKTVLLQLTTRAMTNALYFSTGADNLSREQFSHYGLALNLYTHFTSPIRRYADMLVHRVLLTALGDTRSRSSSSPEDLHLLTADELSTVCQHMNEQHWAAQQVQRASTELFQALLFRDRGETDPVRTVDGIICQLRGSNGFVVLVSRYGIRGSVCVKDPQGQIAWANEDEKGDGRITWMPADSGYEVTRVYATDRDDCGQLVVTNKSAGQRVQVYRVFDHVTVTVHVSESLAHGLSLRLQLVAKQRQSSEEVGEVQKMVAVDQKQITSEIVEVVHSQETKRHRKRVVQSERAEDDTRADQLAAGESVEETVDQGYGWIGQLHDHTTVYHRFAKILRQSQSSNAS